MSDWIKDIGEAMRAKRDADRRHGSTVEPIPNDCLPFNGDPDKIADFLAGPKLDADGKIIGGLFHGWTPDEVLADRDCYNRATGGDGRMW